jgi:hypothetical protein
MTQLIDLCRGLNKKKVAGLEFTPMKELSKDECEVMLNWLLMEGILREGLNSLISFSKFPHFALRFSLDTLFNHFLSDLW